MTSSVELVLPAWADEELLSLRTQLLSMILAAVDGCGHLSVSRKCLSNCLGMMGSIPKAARSRKSSNPLL